MHIPQFGGKDRWWFSKLITHEQNFERY